MKEHSKDRRQFLRHNYTARHTVPEMKMLSLLVISCLVVVASARTHRFEIEDDSFENWNAYKAEHKKSYDSPEEEIRRFKSWRENSRIIKEHNSRADLGHFSHRLAMNQFGDLTNEEFRAKLLSQRATEPRATRLESHGTDFLPGMHVRVPAELDWRKEGFVTAVKRQWQCIGSWAFSATGAMEGQHFRRTGTLVSLSEQQLIDCSWHFGNNGCAAGSPAAAFEFVIAAGLVTEADYPYTATTNNCTEKRTNFTMRIKGYASIEKESEEDLLNAVVTAGPISVKVDASSYAFQFYKEGVLNDTRCSQYKLNQDMLVVGYGVLKGQPYWLVKNSWAVTWGLQGYILMARNASNQCGIATKALFPLL